MDWPVVLSIASSGVSVASLLVARRALDIARGAKNKARESLRTAVYSVEVNRRRLGLPYDHDVVERYEGNEGLFSSMGVGSWDGRRRKDSDGIVQSDDAVQVYADGTYRIIPNSVAFSVLKPVCCREHGTCDDPECPYTGVLGSQRVRTSMVLCPRTGDVYIDTGADVLERIPNARQALSSSDQARSRAVDCEAV